MVSWLILLIAITSTALSLFLWFRDVRRIMQERKSIVESAGGQLAVCRENALKAQGDPEAAAILARSERIYQQAVELYNQTIHKAWVVLPAALMGYHAIG